MRVAKLFTGIFNSRTLSEDRGLIEINGVFNGTIRQGNEVFITPSGRFYGEIEARNVEIAGVVQGDVEAESLVIHSCGQLYYGKLKCQHLSVKDGGTMVNKGKKESEKANDGAGEGYPVNTSNSEYTPEGTVDNSVEAKLRNRVPNRDDTNGELDQDDIRPINNLQPHYQKAKPLQDETNALQAKEQKPHRDRKQPHFYSSY